MLYNLKFTTESEKSTYVTYQVHSSRDYLNA